jgi:molecular chaperone DnaJ
VISTSKACPKCGGRGKIIEKPCAKCRGGGRTPNQEFGVNIPAVLTTARWLNVRGEGHNASTAGPPGFCMSRLLASAPFFERDGFNVWCDSPCRRAGGARDSIQIPTFDGKVRF